MEEIDQPLKFTMTTRLATIDDLNDIVAIYNETIEGRMVTADTEEETVEEKKEVKEEVKITFEDIKPFIEQHLKEGGDKTTAIETAIEKFNTEKLKESRTSIVESIKNKADTDLDPSKEIKFVVLWKILITYASSDKK